MPACRACRSAHLKCSTASIATNSPCTRCSDRNLCCSAFSQPSPVSTGVKRAASSSSSAPTTKSQCVDSIDSHSTYRIPKIKRVLLSFDFGSSYTKSAFRVIFEHENRYPRALIDTRFLSANTSVVTWQSGEEQCPTQLAFKPGSAPHSKPLWGEQVDKALGNNEISETDILSYLKPSLYNEQEDSTIWHQGELLHKVGKLKHHFSFPPRPASQSSRESSFSDGTQESHSDLSGRSQPVHNNMDTIVSLWKYFQHAAFLFVLTKIWRAHARDLPWEPPGSSSGYEDFNVSMLNDCQLEVGITLPAGASVQHVQFALDTARDAGMPNCFPIAEPSAASAFILQSIFERTGTFSDRRAYLLADLGGGSCDVVVFKVMLELASPENLANNHQDKNLCLKELMPGRSNWLGSSSINKYFRKMLAQELDLSSIVEDINSQPEDNRWTVTRLLDKLENLFEAAKRKFEYSDIEADRMTMLKCEELSRVKYHQSRSRKVFLEGPWLSIRPACMKEIFQPCVDGMVSLISQQLRCLAPSKQTPRGGKINPEDLVKDIQLVGGGTNSDYICTQVSAALNRLRFEHNVSVNTESSGKNASLMVCKGALVLLADKDFVGEKILRRGYCFSFDDVARGSKYEKGRLYTCALTGRCMRRDAVKWLCKVGQKVRGSYSGEFQAERLLSKEDPDRFQSRQEGKGGWKIKETLWVSDRQADMQDGIWAESKRHEISRVATISFQLFDSDVANVPVEYNQGNPFKAVEYRSWLRMEEDAIRWFIKIPRSGKFATPELGFVQHEGRMIDCKAAFQMFIPAEKRANGSFVQ